MITKAGAVILARCLSSTEKIDTFLISSEDNVTETTELGNFTSYDLIEVKDTRVTKDINSGKIILLLSTYSNVSSLVTRNIKTVALLSGNNIVAVESTDKTLSPGDVFSQDYYLPFKIF